VAQTIAVLSQKGGTGKTTLVRSLVDVFGRIGMDSLAIDADPQGNLSDYFDVDPEAEPTLSDVLAGKARAIDAIHGDVLPANLSLAEAELTLAGKMGRELTLRNALREIKRRYDVVLIDCPPTLGLLTVNALVAADQALLSTEAEYFSMQGVEQALEVTKLARDNLNAELKILGIVLNIADMRTSHARRTLEALKAYFGEAVCETVIPRSISFPESAERAVPILEHRPARGVDYITLAAELLGRLDMQKERKRALELREEFVEELSAGAEVEAEEEAIREATLGDSGASWKPPADPDAS
jgi:chromosome partitioning protein